MDYRSRFHEKFARLKKRIADTYGVSPDWVERSFSINPQMEVKLNNDIALRSGFLSMVNIVGRAQKTGASLKIGAQNLNTRRADTKNGDERVLGGIKPWRENDYAMVKGHTDFSIHDDDIAEWSQFPDFEQRYRQSYQESIANDRVIIGFHGVANSAPTTDLSTYPLMQDVNKGWFQLLKEKNAANFISEGAQTGEVRIGTGTNDDYANLDACLHDLRTSIPTHRREGLVAVVGSGILAGAQAKLFAAQGNTPTEKERILNRSVIGMYGGLPVVEADFFPDNAIMVTRLKLPGVNSASTSNLSIYYQMGTWKRMVRYEPSVEATIDWNARYECYHIEDLDAIKILQADKVTVGSTVIEVAEADFLEAYS